MNEPTYKINGIERRQLKKELNHLKSFVKNFWNFHNLDKDMCSFYGGKDSYVMSDDNAHKKYEDTKYKITKIEEQLSILYN